MDDIKKILAENLSALRAENKMTQIELAEKLNYTDKSVSKWEHGDAIPPIDVLKDLADLYGVSLDYLVTGKDNYSYDKRYTSEKNTTNKRLITALAVSLVWIISTVLFVYLKIFAKMDFWMTFILAVPVSVIVLLVFNGIWGKRKLTFILISVLIWTALTTIYLFLLQYNLWSIFIIGIPLQAATILWSQLKRSN